MDGLAFSVALGLATTVLLVATGVLVLRRDVHGPSRVALRMYSTWWFAAGAIILMASSHNLLYLMGVLDLRAHLVATYVTGIPVAIALWGLLYYLLYIYTGRPGLLRPLAIAYALFLAFELYYFSTLHQAGLVTTSWGVKLVRTSPVGWLDTLFGILVAAPILAVAVLYALLLRKDMAREQRFRARLTAAAFIVWFTPVLVGYLVGWESADWFPLLYEAPGVAAAAMVVVAQR